MPALKRELNSRFFDTSGISPTRVAYLVLLDSETEINKGRYDHRWVFLESEDWYSRAYTRSTTDAPRGLIAPERIHSSRHDNHRCQVLTKDAAINFIDDFLLTPSPSLTSKLQRASLKTQDWESRLKAIAKNGVICIESEAKKAEMITICASAERY